MRVQEAIIKKEGEITIKGWIHRERGSNKMKFLVVRDTDNIIQCVVKKENVSEEQWELADKIHVEASVEITGTLKADERAPTGVELTVTNLVLVGDSVDFPITKDQSAEHLANFRHLWLRSRYMNAILKIRHTVFQAVREYFNNEGFREFQSPMFQATQGEGGSTLFTAKYFDRETYLAQTWQLYGEAAIQSVEKLYTVAPSFRAENSKTSRHLTEYWHSEMELAWCKFEDLHAYAEGVIKHVVARVVEEHEIELKILERDVEKLHATMEKPFPRMTYDEALKILAEKCDIKLEWGNDLRTIEEDKLSALYDTPIIVTEYPTKVKAFYMKEVDGQPEKVQGFDVIGPEGYGEIIGGSQREEDINILMKRLEEEGEDTSQYGYYFDTRKYGSVPHGGFGMGMERLISWICGLKTIKDAIPFPRTPLRLTP